jgi:hypothetical protein
VDEQVCVSRFYAYAERLVEGGRQPLSTIVNPLEEILSAGATLPQGILAHQASP